MTRDKNVSRRLRVLMMRYEGNTTEEAGQEVTAKEIKAAFDEVRGKNTGSGYIYMLLKRHGWRKVMPRSKHPKAANEEACEASKKLNNVCWIPEKTYSQNFQEKSV